MISMESVAGESSNNGNVPKDDDYRQRILQSAYQDCVVKSIISIPKMTHFSLLFQII